ncbi:MAG: FAD-binding oxidoreductase [Arenicellales bacterium]
MKMAQQQDIVVIGAGVVGASIALALQANGRKVLLLDKTAPCAGASFGNAGGVVNGISVPTAVPGIALDALKMMARPKPPLSIRLNYAHKMMPWLARFLLESRKSKVLQNGQNLYALSQGASAAWLKLTRDTELNDLIKACGWLKVYRSEASFNATQFTRRMMQNNGTNFELLSDQEILDLEPKLAPIFTHGIYHLDCLKVLNPEKMVLGMVDLLQERGGRYQQFDVKHIEHNEQGIVLRNDSSSTIKAKEVVIAAGAWSKTLAQQLGDAVPLETERGYHLMLPEGTQNLLSQPVMNVDDGYVLAPMQMGMRLTSHVELGGLDNEPNYEIIRRLVPEAKQMLPDINTTEQSVWMGCRPSLPDSLPVIGKSMHSDRVTYAFGHQHMGITLATVTAFLVADLLAGRVPSLDLHPYRVNRF